MPKPLPPQLIQTLEEVHEGYIVELKTCTNTRDILALEATIEAIEFLLKGPAS